LSELIAMGFDTSELWECKVSADQYTVFFVRSWTFLTLVLTIRVLMAIAIIALIILILLNDYVFS
jgi:hypothetical protein